MKTEDYNALTPEEKMIARVQSLRNVLKASDASKTFSEENIDVLADAVADRVLEKAELIAGEEPATPEGKLGSGQWIPATASPPYPLTGKKKWFRRTSIRQKTENEVIKKPKSK